MKGMWEDRMKGGIDLQATYSGWRSLEGAKNTQDMLQMVILES